MIMASDKRVLLEARPCLAGVLLAAIAWIG